MASIELSNFRPRLGAIRANFRGKRVRDRLVVIESDDWGAIRTPSRAALKAMQDRGYLTGEGVYTRDALETVDDLERLFEVLLAAKGADGNPALLTANTIVANPDFEAIEANDFAAYHYEWTTETCGRNPSTKGVPDRWKQGFNEGVYRPQFHGREHLHHRRWIDRLRAGDDAARFCFHLGSCSSGKACTMEALEWDCETEVNQQAEELIDGLNIFRHIFGYESRSFIAPCYVWDSALNPVLAKKGVNWLQGTRAQKCPTGKVGEYKTIRHWFGEKNDHGQRYNVRNVHFEPASTPHIDVVSRGLAQVDIAFRMRRPAVINTHRVNYIGSIAPQNADHGLRSLRELLRRITKNWPDARFITTEQLSDCFN